MLDGLNNCLRALLKQVAWPPPLASDPSSTPRPSKRTRSEMEADNGPGAAQLDGGIQETANAAAEGQEGTSVWDGFDAAGPVVSRACCKNL